MAWRSLSVNASRRTAGTPDARGKPVSPHPSRQVQGRTERMGADGRDGVGRRWLVLTLAQRRARGRSNAVQAALARMFCPPMNPPGGEDWGGEA